jgi:hypothetical protein
MSNFMKTNENKFYQKFLKINALKMSEITVFDETDEDLAVFPSFSKVLLELSAYDSFISIFVYIQYNTIQKAYI